MLSRIDSMERTVEEDVTQRLVETEETGTITEDLLLAFLRKQVEEEEGIQPEVDLDAPLAYGYPEVESFFEVSPSRAVDVLEDLSRRNLLDRELEDRVHLCPECEWHNLNFMELCPSCEGIDIGVQEVIHHFSCAYVGAWTAFREGDQLICPKCDKKLRNIGMDYEKPSETYICNDCEHIFTESLVRARCLRDRERFDPDELPLASVYSYHPNQLTRRAIDLGRLEGVDITSVVFDEDARTIRREFLLFELNREIERTERYETDLSMMLLWFDGIDRIKTVPGSNDENAVQEHLLNSVAGAVRTLDLVSNLERGLGAVLLPETDVPGGMVVAERMQEDLYQHPDVCRVDEFQITIALGTIHGDEIEDDAASFLEFVHDRLMEAAREEPGSIVTVERTTGD